MSLIEMLVAAGLSLSLATLVIRAYLAGNALQNETIAELRLHEGARYAFHVVGRSIRLAGFPGCLGETGSNSPLGSAWQDPAPFAPLEAWNSQRPHAEFGAAAEGDVIALWWSVAGCGAAGAPELQPPPTASASPALRGSLFYIGRRGNDADKPPALFVRELSTFDSGGPAQELVEGLRAMRFSFHAAGASALLSADQVQNWLDVDGVRVELRLGSQLLPELEREFSQTVALRNNPLSGVDFPQIEWPVPENPESPAEDEP